MSSPVLQIMYSIIKIDKESPQPIYQQIANCIKEAIDKQLIPKNIKLPGSRSLSNILEVHRKTAIAAYDELQHLGYLIILPNKGTFVNANFPKNSIEVLGIKNHFAETKFDFKKSFLLDNPFEYAECRFSFNDGMPDVRLFKPSIISGYYTSNLRRKQNEKKIGYYNTEGSEFFKYHFANYLNISRGLHISKENLLITRSTEMTVYILSKLLLSRNDIIVVGELSYFAVNMIFQKSGAEIKTIPVDEQGLDIDILEDLCKNQSIRMLYLASHFHYPTTTRLSQERRNKLLKLAEKHHFIIIEDDYDYEFQYENQAFLPLASVDTSGMVIYIGSFGKSLAPGFRTGFAVSSAAFISEMKKYLGIIDKQGDILMEQALGEMIKEGEIDRHLQKSLKIYRERRDIFDFNLQKFFGNQIKYKKPSGGMAFWIEWNKAINLWKIADNCKEKELFIPKTILYQNHKICAMRIGFANMNAEEIENSLQIFSEEAHKVF